MEGTYCVQHYICILLINTNYMYCWELTWHWWKFSPHMALVELIGNSSFLGDLGPDRIT